MEITAIRFSTFLTAPKFFCNSHGVSPSISPSNLSLRPDLKGHACTQTPRPARSPKPITAASALSDETTLSSTVKVAANDPALALKKKAMDVAPDLKGTCIYLVGMKNSLKTQLGKVLAEALRYYYFDSDDLVEEAAGGEASAKLFKETDEQGFRESETEVLKQLSSLGRLVVCAGDGAVQSSTNLALLRHGISIWIEVPLDIIAKGAHSEDLTHLAALYEQMRGGYATADATVSLQRMASFFGYDDFSAVTVEDMAMEVLKEIEKLTRVKKMMEQAGKPF